METYLLSSDQDISTRSRELTRWRPLTLLSIYRSLLSGLFCILFYTKNLIYPLGNSDPDLFFKASLVYFLISLALWSFLLLRNLHFTLQVYIAVIIDIVFITLIMHASGGLNSGIGVLLIVNIAGGSIVLGGRMALALAALATMAILIEQSYSLLSPTATINYPQAGILGITYFVTALLVFALSKRIRESEDLAQRRSLDLANLSQLTEHIIQRMQTGIIVIDTNNTVRLMNESAWHMFGATKDFTARHINYLSEQLAEQLTRWQADQQIQAEAIHIETTQLDVLPRFAKIGEARYSGAVVFLQDMAFMAQQAQQLQLASLGRLTASIAHEIRNPLGAISHAGQLLAESDNLDSNDQRLTQIIADHSKRLNTIVENVMSVSRRRATQVTLFSLKDFLEKFMSDFITGLNIKSGDYEITVVPEDLQVRFDADHLHQILNNLCDNAVRHSRGLEQKPKFILSATIDKDSARPCLDVIDFGPGVSAEDLPHIFEPFYTTETQGTGLGLYLSRELAEGNQATLNYMQEKGQSFFRLTFQDPRRQFE